MTTPKPPQTPRTTPSATDGAGRHGCTGRHRRAGGDGGAGRTTAVDRAAGECDTPEPVKLQLQWFMQAQFAGYYAALDQGFYEDQCIDLEILEGGVEIVPQTQLANGDADFAIAWVPKALASREAGANIANIAQIFQRSGTLQVSFKDAGITTPGRLRRQDDRQLGLRQRVRDLRRPRPGGSRSRHPTSRSSPRTSTWSACSTAASTPPRR